MSLEKSRIPKLGDSSRKVIPEKQRKAMTDPFVERISRTRTDKGETVSGRMVETRSHKSLEERKAMLEVEVHPDQAMNENREIHGPEGRGNRRLASESTPVEQGQDFATSIGTLDQEEMSEVSDISTEIVATRRSPTDNTMMAGVTEKQATSSSFSERVKNTFGNIFPFTMGVGTRDEGEYQEEEEDDEEQADFVSMTNSETRTGENRKIGLSNEVDNEKTSRQRIKARTSTSTKLPGIDRVTPPLLTPLKENGALIEEALNNIMGSIGEQNEQMSIRMSELERAVHVDRESMREELNRNRQEVDRSEKRLKERTEEHIAMNLSRMTREAEQRELRLRDDMEKF